MSAAFCSSTFLTAVSRSSNGPAEVVSRGSKLYREVIEALRRVRESETGLTFCENADALELALAVNNLLSYALTCDDEETSC